MITHVVIFWVDEPYESNRDKLLKGAENLAFIPGVENFSVGGAIPSSRAVVDDSFAVGLCMSFRDRRTAERYQEHPIHREFVKKYARPLAKRFVVYDWT